jgi:hypothetical protein
MQGAHRRAPVKRPDGLGKIEKAPRFLEIGAAYSLQCRQ